MSLLSVAERDSGPYSDGICYGVPPRPPITPAQSERYARLYLASVFTDVPAEEAMCRYYDRQRHEAIVIAARVAALLAAGERAERDPCAHDLWGHAI